MLQGLLYKYSVSNLTPGSLFIYLSIYLFNKSLEDFGCTPQSFIKSLCSCPRYSISIKKKHILTSLQKLLQHSQYMFDKIFHIRIGQNIVFSSCFRLWEKSIKLHHLMKPALEQENHWDVGPKPDMLYLEPLVLLRIGKILRLYLATPKR